MLDRRALTTARIEAMADGLRHVATLPDPVGEVVRGSSLPNGLELRQVRVPLGVVGIVYEARPNVTVDAASEFSRPMHTWANLAVGAPNAPHEARITLLPSFIESPGPLHVLNQEPATTFGLAGVIGRKQHMRWLGALAHRGFELKPSYVPVSKDHALRRGVSLK